MIILLNPISYPLHMCLPAFAFIWMCVNGYFLACSVQEYISNSTEQCGYLQVWLQFLSIIRVASICELTCHTETSCSLNLPKDTQPCVTLAQGPPPQKKNVALKMTDAVVGVRPRILHSVITEKPASVWVTDIELEGMEV